MCRTLVQFPDGSYGIRYGLLFHTYQDFEDTSFAWGRERAFSIYKDDCRTTLEKAKAFFDRGSKEKVIDFKIF